MRELHINKQSKRFLDNLLYSNKKIANKISFLIEDLRINPLLPGSKQLVGYKELYRLRVEDYRLVYQFDQSKIY